jgi:hypothetical protein
LTGEFFVQTVYSYAQGAGHRQRIKERPAKQLIKEIRMIVAVTIFFISCAIVAFFQSALALGAPWGEYTLGGRFPGKLPPKMRIAALVQILIVFAFAFIVLVASGLAFSQFLNQGKIAIWLVVAFFVFGSILNVSTPSKGERMIWGPVNLLVGEFGGRIDKGALHRTRIRTLEVFRRTYASPLPFPAGPWSHTSGWIHRPRPG